MIYEYRCPICGIITIDCKMSEYKSEVTCPVCHQLCTRDFSDYKPSVHLTAGMYGIDKNGGWNV